MSVESTIASNPLVSIVIPVYNSEIYIGETIQSCLNQSYSHIELILINDGSTDDSESVIKAFDDSRIRYQCIENSGSCIARNVGISNAKGELIQFLDHDDLLDSMKLKHQVAAYLEYGEDWLYSGRMGSVSGSCSKLDENYELYERDFDSQSYFETVLNQFGKYVTTGAWLLPRKLVESTHGWDPKAGLNDDGEYFMRVILNSKGIKYCSESIFYFRRDVPNSLSKKFETQEVYEKWLYSYQSYVREFQRHFDRKTARELGWKALSVYFCDSFPNYPLLGKQCRAQMRSLGFRYPYAHGGGKLVTLARYMGIMNALRLWELKRRFIMLFKSA